VTSIKRLRSVCHSIAQHATSSMSCVQPHLGQECRAAGLATVSVDLLAERPYPPGLGENMYLGTALGSLKKRFERILAAEGIQSEQLREAHLRFTFPYTSDDFSSCCFALLTTLEGRSVRSAADSRGRKIEVDD
jgi:hypothetical protein